MKKATHGQNCGPKGILINPRWVSFPGDFRTLFCWRLPNGLLGGDPKTWRKGLGWRHAPHARPRARPHASTQTQIQPPKPRGFGEPRLVAEKMSTTCCMSSGLAGVLSSTLDVLSPSWGIEGQPHPCGKCKEKYFSWQAWRLHAIGSEFSTASLTQSP